MIRATFGVGVTLGLWSGQRSLSVLTGRWGRKEQGEDKRPLRGKLLVGGCVFVYLSIGIMGCLVLLYLRTDSNPLH